VVLIWSSGLGATDFRKFIETAIVMKGKEIEYCIDAFDILLAFHAILWLTTSHQKLVD